MNLNLNAHAFKRKGSHRRSNLLISYFEKSKFDELFFVTVTKRFRVNLFHGNIQVEMI